VVLFILTDAQVLDEDDDGRAEQVSILASVLSGLGSLVVSLIFFRNPTSHLKNLLCAKQPGHQPPIRAGSGTGLGSKARVKRKTHCKYK